MWIKQKNWTGHQLITISITLTTLLIVGGGCPHTTLIIVAVKFPSAQLLCHYYNWVVMYGYARSGPMTAESGADTPATNYRVAV